MPEQAAAMTGLALMQDVIAGKLPVPPIGPTAGFCLIEVNAGRAVFVGQPSRAFLNPLGTVHGGWITAILDSSLGCAVHTTLAAGEAYTTLAHATTTCMIFPA